jgi:hypothetical protein
MIWLLMYMARIIDLFLRSFKYRIKLILILILLRLEQEVIVIFIEIINFDF